MAALAVLLKYRDNVAVENWRRSVTWPRLDFCYAGFYDGKNRQNNCRGKD